MGMVLGRIVRYQTAAISRVRVKAVNTVVMMPMPSVSANPRTGPVPTKNSTSGGDEGGDVGIDDGRQGAREAGVEGGDRTASGAHFLAQTFVDEHVGIDRHADGEHDAGDAGQRQRRIEERQDTEDHGDVDGHRDIGENAEQAVGGEHEADHQRGAHIGCRLALGDGVLAQPGADGAFLDHRQRRRQRAGAQQNGQVVGAARTVKRPEICPEPPRIGSRITGAEITLLSSTMANGRPTLVLGDHGKLAGARQVKLKRKLTTGS